MPPIFIPIVVIGVLLVIFLVYLFLIHPNRHRKQMDAFLSPTRYAHRGLHGNGVAENSMTAFRLAVEHGFGIEFDVRLCKSGELVVFHDPTLKRVTGEEGKVIDKTLDELKAIHLSGTEDVVPTLDELLALVDGKVPLLVEIKQDVGEKNVAERTIERLKEYHGAFIVESFNPLAIGKVKKGLPNVCRGVLSAPFLKDKETRKPMFFLLENLLLNFIAKPDFIAYNYKGWKNLSLRLVKKWFRGSLVTWTIRSQADEDEAFAHGFDAVIFENYLPREDS